jgi:DNA-binding transcriptional MocR family regulator
MTLTETVMQDIQRRIETNALKVGDRLPSIRRAADEFGVSKNTIVEAYDRLLAAGFVKARQGYGFTVVDNRRPASGERPRHVAEAVDIASLLSAQLEESFSIRVGDGRPPPSWTEESEVRRHLGRGRKAGDAPEQGYGAAMGLPALRERLAVDFAEREVQAHPDQILLTFGANHALDLVIRRYLLPGDTVLVDEPGYYPLFAKLKLAQVRMVGVRRLPTGPDPDDLRAKAESLKPKMFFTQSMAHNPTGGSTNLPTAHALLTIAAQHDLMIVEDEPFVDLPTVRSAGLTPLDQLTNVISIGTFSKTLSASLRCGFIAAHADIIGSLVELKMLTTVNSSGHVEQLVNGLLVEGHYRRHLKRLGRRIAGATDTVTANLQRHGFEVFTEPTGGYYVYLVLPPHVDDIALAKAGAQEGIFIAPGSVFCVDREAGRNGTRINIARADTPRFYEFLKRAFAA